MIGPKFITDDEADLAGEEILELEERLEVFREEASLLAYDVDIATERYVEQYKHVAERAGARVYLRKEPESFFPLFSDIDCELVREDMVVREPVVNRQQTYGKFGSLKERYGRRIGELIDHAVCIRNNMDDTIRRLVSQTTFDLKNEEKRNGRYLLHISDRPDSLDMVVNYDIVSGVRVKKVQAAEILSFALNEKYLCDAERDNSDFIVVRNQSRYVRNEDMLQFFIQEIQNVYSKLVRPDGSLAWVSPSRTDAARLLEDYFPLLHKNAIRDRLE